MIRVVVDSVSRTRNLWGAGVQEDSGSSGTKAKRHRK